MNINNKNNEKEQDENDNSYYNQSPHFPSSNI